jgi:hypothetical protein
LSSKYFSTMRCRSSNVSAGGWRPVRAALSQKRRGDLLCGSGEDGYGLGLQDPPVPSRSAKHCCNVSYRQSA